MEENLVCEKWDNEHDIGEGIIVRTRWSRKPKEQGRPRLYNNYFEKINTYAREVSFHAESKKPGILAVTKSGESPKVDLGTPFHYFNTRSYQNGIKGIEDKIKDEKVAVIGVGGTGSYLVDVLAKTDIQELHLYDDDSIDPGSAFRLAGAVKINELNSPKVEWHKDRYSSIRAKGFYTHKEKIDNSNIEDLKKYTTVSFPWMT